MAKKKSKRFIIPATFFINTVIEEKLDSSTKVPKLEAPKDNSNIVQEPQNNLQKEKPIQATEIQKPTVLKQNTKRQSALSISSLKRDKIEKEKLKNINVVVENIDNLPKDPFTESTFFEFWNNYTKSLHENGEKIFASILNADTPKIQGNLICVTYPNQMMKAELNKVKHKALKYLREKLNNYSIDFKITVNEENTKKFAYTSQEKYELLKEKNKAIITLRKTFNLEL